MATQSNGGKQRGGTQKKTPNLDEWLSEKVHVRYCKTCSSSDSVLEFIDKYMNHVIAGTSEKTLRDLWFLLRQHMGYALSEQSLRRHMCNCKPETWAKYRAARR